MSEAASASVDNDTLRVSGVLDFESVPLLQPIGQQWLAGCSAPVCRLDLGGVTYSSSVGLALVLEWLRAAVAADKSLQIDNMPADMTALVRVGGLDFLLPAA